MYIILSLISGIILGFFYILKKKTLENNDLIKVLFAYAAINLLLVSFEFPNAIKVKEQQMILIVIKSVIIYTGWLLSFKAVKELPISISSTFNIANPVFTVMLGIILLGEHLKTSQLIALGLILLAYYFISKVGKVEVNNIFVNPYVYFMIISMFLSSISATIDKIVLKDVTTGQLQFWFNFYIALFTGLTFLVLKIRKSIIIQNKFKFDYFIPLMSVALVATDRIYFTAVKIPQSNISVVIPIRYVAVIISTILGGWLFKEKNISKKLKYLCLLIIGLVILFMNK
jgi:drug/metabolite transporter (DMT)-like permease